LKAKQAKKYLNEPKGTNKGKGKAKKGKNHHRHQMKKSIFVWIALAHFLTVGLAKNGSNSKESVNFGPIWNAQMVAVIMFVIIVMSLIS
jgi:hypothetical protein